MIFPEPIDGLRDSVAWPVLPVTPPLPTRPMVDLEPFPSPQAAAPDDSVQLGVGLPCVGEFMCTDVITIAPDRTVTELEALLLEHNISGVPVTENKTLLGVVTQADVVQYHYGKLKKSRQSQYHGQLYFDPNVPAGNPSLTRVCEIMTPYIFFATEDATVVQVLDMMLRHHIHRVLITRERQLVGVVTSMDLLQRYRHSLINPV